VSSVTPEPMAANPCQKKKELFPTSVLPTFLLALSFGPTTT
jgi:hypothetical protein